jgi:hypothetical protein
MPADGRRCCRLHVVTSAICSQSLKIGSPQFCRWHIVIILGIQKTCVVPRGPFGRVVYSCPAGCRDDTQ